MLDDDGNAGLSQGVDRRRGLEADGHGPVRARERPLSV